MENRELHLCPKCEREVRTMAKRMLERYWRENPNDPEGYNELAFVAVPDKEEIPLLLDHLAWENLAEYFGEWLLEIA